MTAPEDGQIWFELRGTLSPERFAELSEFLTQAAMQDSVSLTQGIPNPEGVLTSDELEERFDTEFLTPLRVDGIPTYLVTEIGMRKFFESSAEVNDSRIRVAWQNLDNHSKRLHNPFSGEKCPCTMHPVFNRQPVRVLGREEPVVRGITPDGLVSVASVLHKLPSGYARNIDSRPAALIRNFIETIALKTPG